MNKDEKEEKRNQMLCDKSIGFFKTLLSTHFYLKHKFSIWFFVVITNSYSYKGMFHI